MGFIARKHNIHLFSDEMYRFLEFDKKYALPSAADEYEKGIALFGMSKTFGMPGARIGWLTMQDKNLYQAIATLKDYTTICPPAPSEILSLIALRNKDQIIQKHKNLLQKNLKIFRQFLKEHHDLFSLIEPKGGSICFPRLLGKETASAFCTKLVEKSEIINKNTLD